MRTTVPRQWLFLTLGLIFVTPAVSAGVFKGHPYHDPHSTIRSGSYSGDTSKAPCNCPSTTHSSLGSGESWNGSGSCANCPPVTNALLRVWASDDATVYVNGVKTKPQYLSGANRGSRIFSLTHLSPGQVHEAVVTVAHPQGQRTERIKVKAGESYDVRLTDLPPTSYAILEHHRPLHAWVHYKNADDSIAQFYFDVPSTRSLLRFQEQTGAIARMNGVEVIFKYYFTLQVPDANVPGGFRDDETFAILEQTVVFNSGMANVPFFDKARPGEHLSATFKKKVEEKWLRGYRGYRVKVGITAALPGDPEQPVGPAGNPMTIVVQER